MLLSCEKDHTQLLSGNWNAYLTKWTGDTLETRLINIRQDNSDVNFYESNDLISSGKIINDTINCSEFYGVTIIYIDSKNHMHSELPLAEDAGRRYFERIE
jgi:hypothetical protein